MGKLKLEAGKYYRTRDGRKVGPMKYWTERYGAFKYGVDEPRYSSNGMDGWEVDCDSFGNLIAEWSDTPSLKVGDKVRVIAGYGTLFNGRTGIVTHVDGDDAYVASKSNLPTGYYQGDDFHLYFWGRELEPIPTIGTLAEIGAQVGDVVGCVPDGARYTVLEGQRLLSRRGDLIEYSHFWGNADSFRIISRASDAKSPVKLSVDLGEAIKQVVAESQSGPVQLRKVIVPGVYGKVNVEDVAERIGIMIDDYMTRDDLTEAIATLTAIRDAL